jgi:lipopolysaccharide export system permease protein
MGSIDRYIFRTTLGAFLLILVSLTSIIWVTQALRDIDLMTSQGQTILTFIGITGLVIPQLVLVIAPIALVISVAHVLNKLATDSEIIVMNSAGMSPWRLFRPFLEAAVVVALLVGFVSAYLSPKCLRELRQWAASVRADLVTNIIQPGRFTSIERGLVFHLRERLPNGQLLGLFIDDQRNPQEETTLLAEQGEIVESERGTFLLLGNGSLQHRSANERDPAIVKFDRHAFDLSQYSSQGGQAAVNFSVRELPLWDLLFPAPNNPTLLRDPGQFRAEFHDRIVAPLYPIAFTVIAFAWLGAPRTTRQNRAMSMVATILAVSSLRLIGFASMVFGIFAPLLLSLQYIAIVVMAVISIRAIASGTAIEIPAPIVAWWNAIGERLARRVATA